MGRVLAANLAHLLSVLCPILVALVVMLAGFQPIFAQGHLHSWNTHAREKSQRYLSAAVTALNKGFLEKAATLLIQATNTDPTDAASFAVLGLTYLRQEKYSEALEALKKAYRIDHNWETLLSTGFAYYLQHDYEAAINAWSKTLERNPNLAEAHGAMGFAFMRMGDFVKADESFRNLIKYRPSSQLAYHGLAQLNYLAGNLSASRKAAEHAQSIQSYFPVILLLAKLDYLQGDAKAGQKRVAEWARMTTSKKALSRSMNALGYPTQHDFKWDPFLADNFDNGRLLMARTQGGRKKGSESRRKSLAQRGKIQDLLSKAQQAHAISSKDFYIARELALLQMAAGGYAASADKFRLVLQLCPSCQVDWLHLARALSMQDKGSEAAYAAREYQRLHASEKIADAFAELAKGEAVAIPELSPQPEAPSKKKDPNESGF